MRDITLQEVSDTIHSSWQDIDLVVKRLRRLELMIDGERVYEYQKSKKWYNRLRKWIASTH